jgi:hypothetical protein
MCAKLRKESDWAGVLLVGRLAAGVALETRTFGDEAR